MTKHQSDDTPYVIRCALKVKTHYQLAPADTAATTSFVAVRDTKEKIPGVTKWISESIEVEEHHQIVRLTFSTNGQAPLSVLLQSFPQFHLLWRDEQACAVEQNTGKRICARFGEAWTAEFTPLWFSNKEYGDRYDDEDTGAILVFNRIRHEILNGDIVFTVGEPDAEYSYGVGINNAAAEFDGEQVAAPLACAVSRGGTDR